MDISTHLLPINEFLAFNAKLPGLFAIAATTNAAAAAAAAAATAAANKNIQEIMYEKSNLNKWNKIPAIFASICKTRRTIKFH